MTHFVPVNLHDINALSANLSVVPKDYVCPPSNILRSRSAKLALSNIHQMNYYTHGPLQNHCHLLYAGSIPKLQWNGNLEWWCLHCWNYRMIILSTYILSTERIMYNINLPPSGGTDFFLIQQGLTTGEHSKWKFYFLYMFSIRDLEGRIKKS